MIVLLPDKGRRAGGTGASVRVVKGCVRSHPPRLDCVTDEICGHAADLLRGKAITRIGHVSGNVGVPLNDAPEKRYASRYGGWWFVEAARRRGSRN